MSGNEIWWSTPRETGGIWELLYGNREPSKAGNSGAESNPGEPWHLISSPRSAGKGAATRKAISAYLARTGSGVSPKSFTAKTFTWSKESALVVPKVEENLWPEVLALPESTYNSLYERMISEASKSIMLPPPEVNIEKAEKAVTYNNFFSSPSLYSELTNVTRQWHGYFAADPAHDSQSICDGCGAVTAKGHTCPVPDQVDIDTVRTIQTLAAEGLSPDEIAADTGVRVGWRHWGVSSRGLTGSGAGVRAAWIMDKPQLSICATGCGAREALRCGKSAKPQCRVHAAKRFDHVEIAARDESWKAGNDLVLGQVAMWGDAVECEEGYLASRAYPIGLCSELWARAYRVPFITKPATRSLVPE